MKKLSIFLLLILCACTSIRKDDLYSINIDGTNYVVGYDDSSFINENIDSYSLTTLNDKEVLSSLTVYVNDVNSISIDSISISDSISETCSLLNGEMENNNGYVCLVSKRVNRHDNYILIYGDILDDNLDRTDRVEIHFN